MIEQRAHGLVYYRFPRLAGAEASGRLVQGAFTRHGGVSTGIYNSLNLSRSTGDEAAPVQENRLRMFAALQVKAETHVTSWLVHGNVVRVIDRESLRDPGHNDLHADGMVCNTPGITLTMRYADCVPIVLFDPVRNTCGIAHAGWPGVVAGVIAATVAALANAFGSRPGDVIAGIGPSIGPEKFEVGEDVAEKIQAAVDGPVIERKLGPKPHVNLWRATANQLRACGVRNIDSAGICTASSTADWFSHRAEKGKTGRFGVAIGLR